MCGAIQARGLTKWVGLSWQLETDRENLNDFRERGQQEWEPRDRFWSLNQNLNNQWQTQGKIIMVPLNVGKWPGAWNDGNEGGFIWWGQLSSSLTNIMLTQKDFVIMCPIVNHSLSKRAYNGCKLHCKFIKSLEAFKWKEAEKIKDKSIWSQHTLQQVTLSRTLGFSTAHGAKHHLLQSNLQTH